MLWHFLRFKFFKVKPRRNQGAATARYCAALGVGVAAAVGAPAGVRKHRHRCGSYGGSTPDLSLLPVYSSLTVGLRREEAAVVAAWACSCARNRRDGVVRFQ